MPSRFIAPAPIAWAHDRETIRPRAVELGSALDRDGKQELLGTATAAASARVVVGEPVGTNLGRYRVERELGAGAMGVVHVAFDLELERRIALKVLRSATATPGVNERLIREARAMARLAHPNVVTVHEVGTAGDRGFVAMELIQGETLAEWLAASKRPLAEILDAFLSAGRGLAAAHAAGIVHRDFKPRNVLRGHDGRIAVTDFGLACEVEVAPSAVLDATSSLDVVFLTPDARAKLTTTGSLLGTPAYMAPEQWCGGEITPAADQFAYCMALWEAITGERPYRGSSAKKLRDQIARGPMTVDARRIPRSMRGALRRGLDPDPARRWPSMTALLERLARARRRPGIVLEIARTALVVATALVAARRGGDAPGLACEPPTRDVAPMRSLVIAAGMRATSSEMATPRPVPYARVPDPQRWTTYPSGVPVSLTMRTPRTRGRVRSRDVVPRRLLHPTADRGLPCPVHEQTTAFRAAAGAARDGGVPDRGGSRPL